MAVSCVAESFGAFATRQVLPHDSAPIPPTVANPARSDSGDERGSASLRAECAGVLSLTGMVDAMQNEARAARQSHALQRQVLRR